MSQSSGDGKTDFRPLQANDFAPASAPGKGDLQGTLPVTILQQTPSTALKLNNTIFETTLSAIGAQQPTKTLAVGDGLAKGLGPVVGLTNGLADGDQSKLVSVGGAITRDELAGAIGEVAGAGLGLIVANATIGANYGKKLLGGLGAVVGAIAGAAAGSPIEKELGKRIVGPEYEDLLNLRLRQLNASNTHQVGRLREAAQEEQERRFALGRVVN
jgi:hypothetical protein